MATDLDTIKSTLVGISKGEGILDMLIEFERTLDNAEIFAYKNWILGELVEGPIIDRYWFKTVWMFPEKMMPDPNAGLRLTKLGAKVSFKKGTFSKPVKVKGPQSWADPQTKRAKMAEHNIWLVTLELPMKYIKRGLAQIDDIIQQDIDNTNEQLADAYDEVPEDTGNEMPQEEMDQGMENPDEMQQGGV